MGDSFFIAPLRLVARFHCGINNFHKNLCKISFKYDKTSNFRLYKLYCLTIELILNLRYNSKVFTLSCVNYVEAAIDR